MKFKTYLLSEAVEPWELVPYEIYDGSISDPYQVEGALEIQVNQRQVIKLETEGIDALWTNLGEAVDQILEGKNLVKAPLPDQPGDFVFRVVGKGKLEVVLADKRLVVDKRTFCEAASVSAWAFYKKMSELLPEKADSYAGQELKLLESVFSRLGLPHP